MNKDPEIALVEVALDQKLSRLTRKYTDEVVIQTLHEIGITGEEDEFLRTCGWNSEMTLVEALECLQDYCDFVETTIRTHLEKGKSRQYLPAFFN